ncbi:unnamed protein product [Diabrotica balteata]|uniref:Uncharacterized protein n=1 Tax=Diabrotica balteata TaxID=107213 RepID=A0A9N9TAJ7_DIABA|nr:unnamed protein product [Diabrotica balteata]
MHHSLLIVFVSFIVEKRILQTPPQVNLEELADLEGPQLAELVRLYMQENEALRKDNAELFTSRDLLQRDHEVVCRENERLLKKLEEVNSFVQTKTHRRHNSVEDKTNGAKNRRVQTRYSDEENHVKNDEK